MCVRQPHSHVYRTRRSDIWNIGNFTPEDIVHFEANF